MIGEIIIIFVLFGLVIMTFPVTLSVNSARRDGIIDGFFSISWIIFIFSYSIREKQSEIRIFKRRLLRHSHNTEISETKEKPGKKTSLKKIPSHGNILNLIRPMIQLLKDVFGCIKLEKIDIGVKFGANDPAHTGILAGIFYAISGCSQAGNKIKLALDFEKPCLEWDLVVKAALTPIRMFPPVIKFITDRRVLSSGFQILRG